MTTTDECCACHEPADPAKYVAGLGLMCLECFTAEFESGEDDDDEHGQVLRSGGLLP